jgi:16S rRNA processing protein RimM
MPRVRFVAVGRVGRPHGLRGELRVDPLGGLPRGLEGYSRFYLARGDEWRPVAIETHRPHGRFVLVRFAGYDSPDTARQLAHSVLYVERSEMPPLEEGEYYHADLLDACVVDEQDRELGSVVDIFPGGAHDVLVVASSDREWMLPVVSEYVLTMDLEQGKIVVRVPPELMG